ncbi:CPBP family intramembrane glutamic endopeptidase [Microbacterium sulfonylureivorans]|uniref:CPBP family intramembrane glutamic endopeptidase n=1 Tax=Microbacterium sulfonylureivorans TaxID=2486854 RepID=UPI000FDCC40A|nr:type II CAAX endopeptidase family protein [Microbacterium sulfonylureivorans]
MRGPGFAQRRLPVRILLFAVFAFAISWTLWFLHPVFSADPSAAVTLDQLATFGPAAAALLVASDRSAVVGGPPRVRAAVASLLVFAVTVLLLAPRWTDASSPAAIVLLAVLTAIPAALVWAAGSRVPRVSHLLSSILVPRSPWWTYVVALLLFPAASALGGGLVVLLGGEFGPWPLSISESVIGILAVFGVTLLFGGPLGEEVGWRGWLLPALQVRLSPLLASLIVGLVWGLWHLPLHLRGMYDADMGAGLVGFATRIASSCLLAVLFTWLYNRSRGGLLVMILLHTSVNNASGYWMPVNAGTTAVLLLIAVGVVVGDRMYARPPAVSHRRSTWLQES